MDRFWECQEGIEYITPNQCDQGLLETIVAPRTYSREAVSPTKGGEAFKTYAFINGPVALIVNLNQIVSNSVMYV